MKLLFDENLSASLVELLTPEFPGSVHVEHVLGRGRSDAEVWEFARANGYAIAGTCGIIWRFLTTKSHLQCFDD